MKRKSTKFVIAGVIIFLAIGFMIYSSINRYSGFYLKPGELVAKGESAYGEQLRLNGKVAANSVDWKPEIPRLKFKITDGKTTIPVVYKDLPPDTFKEGVEVVIEGVYTKEGTFKASSLLAKCPSKYESKKKEKK